MFGVEDPIQSHLYITVKLSVASRSARKDQLIGERRSVVRLTISLLLTTLKPSTSIFTGLIRTQQVRIVYFTCLHSSDHQSVLDNLPSTKRLMLLNIFNFQLMLTRARRVVRWHPIHRRRVEHRHSAAELWHLEILVEWQT